jgi:uncharacterized protein involved in outer membrane biogenesis
MKWVKRMGIGLLVILIVLILVINFFGGSLIKKGIETAAPGILGVPVTVEDVNFHLIAGKVGIKNLIIGNPEGFKSDYLFKLGTLKVSLNMRSLLSDTIIIEEIRVLEPGVNYELALGSSNIGQLLENLEGDEPKEEKPEEAEPAEADPDKPAKTVIIERFEFTGGEIGVKAKMLAGQGITVSLPDIVLRDLGKKEEGGVSLVDIIRDIIKAIAGAVTDVATGSVKLLGDGAKAAAGMAADGVGAAGDAAVKGAKMAGDATLAAGDAAVDGVKAAGDMAGDTIGAAADLGSDAVGAVGKGASKLVGGLGGLLGGKDKDEKKEE